MPVICSEPHRASAQVDIGDSEDAPVADAPGAAADVEAPGGGESLEAAEEAQPTIR